MVYDSARWKALRERVLAASGYKDELERRSGRSIPADTVHHIFPRDKYPQYQLKRWNLIAVSNDTHERLHNRGTGDLSALGYSLMEETAKKYRIPMGKLVLVIGLPGTGKTTYVQQQIGNALVYDIDYIASAFRLKQPHEEHNEAAYKMAESMAKAFAANAMKYSGTVYIIRTAPTLEEYFDINPDMVVICNKHYSISARRDYKRLTKAKEDELVGRINEIREYCAANGLELMEL